MLGLIIRVVGLLLLAFRLEGATRLDTRRVTVSIAGQHLGVWDYKEGGEVDSAETKYKPGGMEPEVNLGGTRTTGNVTLRRLYRLARDHAISQRYIDWAGKASVVVVDQPLDHDGNAWGKPFAYRGKLKRVTFPNHDSQSSDAALIEIEVTPDGYPTGMDS